MLLSSVGGLDDTLAHFVHSCTWICRPSLVLLSPVLSPISSLPSPLLSLFSGERVSQSELDRLVLTLMKQFELDAEQVCGLDVWGLITRDSAGFPCSRTLPSAGVHPSLT